MEWIEKTSLIAFFMKLWYLLSDSEKKLDLKQICDINGMFFSSFLYGKL